MKHDFISPDFVLDKILQPNKHKMEAIAGGPRVGKTTVFFSLGHNKWQIIRRLQSLNTGMSEEDNTTFFLDDTPCLSTSELRKKVMSFNNEKDIDVIIIDDLTLMLYDKKLSNRMEEVSCILKFIRELAYELNITIICTFHFSRPLDFLITDNYPRAYVKILKEMDIERYFDSLYMLWRPAGYTRYKQCIDEDGNDMTYITRFTIYKHQEAKMCLRSFYLDLSKIML